MAVDPAALTERQIERRRRVLRAALELAAEGGYDAVQMRDVATRAEVALGTVYHYFGSKDHLLAAALLEWTAPLERAIRRRPVAGSTTRERLVDLLHRMTDGMGRDPTLTIALLTGLTAPDPDAGQVQLQVNEVWNRLMVSAFDPEDDPERRAKVIRTLEHVWFSGLLGWVNGWSDLDRATRDFEDAASLLLGEA